jgi:hypothetical protein
VLVEAVPVGGALRLVALVALVVLDSGMLVMVGGRSAVEVGADETCTDDKPPRGAPDAVAMGEVLDLVPTATACPFSWVEQPWTVSRSRIPSPNTVIRRISGLPAVLVERPSLTTETIHIRACRVAFSRYCAGASCPPIRDDQRARRAGAAPGGNTNR